ncbi:hypothetical protein [Brevibacterium gallinarum]|uniref:Uncharacterized protein n=1 Tax=Brevibacterium gallinarum TaxID=2762220 RepID=A0ABR8WS46_9MICO|nr:hypothetical protein [Brevibacterium gallinarum]MBD8019909.1 hypothetical protein [Brevibacterium gallinarum]
MSVDPDDEPVEIGHDGGQTGHAMFSSLIGLDVVAGVSPGEKSRRGEPVMSHTTHKAIAVVDMLLIKPSLWATGDAGTQRPLDRSRV